MYLRISEMTTGVVCVCVCVCVWACVRVRVRVLVCVFHNNSNDNRLLPLSNIWMHSLIRMYILHMM